ncbi:MAG: ABC transporter ATP-binding protein [Phycisphaerae bacterium]|nr:ABC transporter ATP-binding protein [Phycisphaerae bacterium]
MKTKTKIKQPLIRVKDLHKTYSLGRVSLEVLRGVSFEIAAGEFVALYGHSGSGKSTLLHMVGLLDRPTSGIVHFDGINVAKLRSGRRNSIRCNDVGFVFQFYHLLPELTVLENTMLPGMVGNSILRWPGRKKALRLRAMELLDELGVSDRLKHRPRELSGGERQRVAIARALIHKPKLLLADEPTGNLDSKTGQKIMDVLLRYNRQHGQTILMVTHDEELAEEVSRAMYIKDGRLVSG